MKKTKTIYYLPMFGQLGNQLALLAHLIAFALEYNFTIVHFASDSLLKTLDKNSIQQAPLRFNKRLNNKTVSFVINKLTKLFCLNRNRFFSGCLFLNQEFNVDKDFNTKTLPRVIVITDWLFRYYSGVIKHQQGIRRLLSFDETLSIKAKQFLQLTKTNFPLRTLIGVHIRRGDYATWLNGKYFFSDEVYYSKIKRLATQIEDSLFIVCSNEEVSFNNIYGLQILYTKGTPAEDIYILSHCDYIVGTNSTFSSWAAFIGDKYIFQFEDKNDDVDINSFKKYYL